ncbi:MAG TPA: protein phosphatase 2C domain-containing protein [Herpetosiphon sp.]|uniref:Protein serine/threonine phosphatase n=1 Tax=Herpetosiphon aurantiacus (strain ATCC 23779 / DSM 785 / 114-95) TaxID=316274 RepID=A9AV56_HERA2|nr:PP2C family serine/threonine-protein phosphatase [Herpetosiphon sp.]ABX03134.1 protein serine/threonine phosphatase [Herpetosiphon aurantiacus DSM 785]HBW50765.1 protein phosphatase 2C domain-containing protein [Herpetosiphon sp.]
MKQNQRPLIFGLFTLLLLSSMLIGLLLIRLSTTKQQATVPNQQAATTKQQATATKQQPIANSRSMTITQSILLATLEAIPAPIPTIAPISNSDLAKLDLAKPTPVLRAANNTKNDLITGFLWLSVLILGGYFLWSRWLGSLQLLPQDHPRPTQSRPKSLATPPINPVQPKPSPAIVPMPASSPRPTAEPRRRNANYQLHIFQDSVIGLSHTQHGLPCQDSSAHRALDNGWGVAVVADGLGSRKLSDRGSQFVVKHTCEKLFDLLHHYAWHKTNQLPTEQQWQGYVKAAFYDVYKELLQEAKVNDQSIHEYACTLISVIYSPIGILVAHVGDGRAGYSDRYGQWHSMITPHKGEEANEVMPFTADQVWKNPQELIECRVIQEPICGFVLMSDGCEKHTFQCSQFDQANERWHDPNQPHQQFFDRLQQLFREQKQKGCKAEELKKMFKDILLRGTTGFANESDDKTMILGLWI